MEISSENFRHSSAKLTTKNAWAQWARRRYPNNGVKGLMSEYRLTEGEAKGVIYAQASQTTIDKLLEHPGDGPGAGFALGLEILAIKTGITLEQHIDQQAKEAANARTEWEARERHIARLQSSLRTEPDRRSFMDR